MTHVQGIGNGTYTVPPGVTIPAVLVPSVNTNRSSSDVNEFLNFQGRKCQAMKGDGNCMYRAIAHQLYGLEEKHQQLRKVLKETIEGNKEWYRCLWMGNDTFDNHLSQIQCNGVWGTQVELQATSDLLGVSVYVGRLNTRDIYCWHQFKPRTINRPETPCNLPVYPFTADHIEIVQSNRSHYDSVVPMFPGAHALQCPQMNTQCVLKTIQID